MKNIIKKFESYEIDMEGEIAEEYAKLIISTYLDKKYNTTLEQVFYDIVSEDQGSEENEDIIKNELIYLIKKMYQDSKKIREISTIKASKFNL